MHATKPFEWLPYFDIEVQVSGKETGVFTLIVPVEDLEEAQRILRSVRRNEKQGRLKVTLATGAELEFEVK